MSGETGIYSYVPDSTPGGGTDCPAAAPEGKDGRCLATSFWGRQPGRDARPANGKDLSARDFRGFMEADRVLVPGSEVCGQPHAEPSETPTPLVQ